MPPNMTGSYQIRYSDVLVLDELLWDKNENGDINRNLNNAFIACWTQEQNTVSVERRTAIARIRVSARDMAYPIALFWVVERGVGERSFWRWSIGKSLKFLANVTRNVFVRTKF